MTDVLPALAQPGERELTSSIRKPQWARCLVNAAPQLPVPSTSTATTGPKLGMKAAMAR